MPETIDMRIFWASGALLVLALTFAPRVCSRAQLKSRSGRRRASLLAAISFGCALCLLYPLSRWNFDRDVFGQLFSWICAHGMIAALFIRLGFTILASLRKGASTPNGD